MTSEQKQNSYNPTIMDRLEAAMARAWQLDRYNVDGIAPEDSQALEVLAKNKEDIILKPGKVSHVQEPNA